MSIHKRTVPYNDPQSPTPVLGGFHKGEGFTLIREHAGALVPEAGPFTAGAYPPQTVAFACDRYDTVLLGVSFTGVGTLQISPMLFDVDAQQWVDLWVGGGPVAYDTFDGSGSRLVSFTVFGAHAVFFRFAAMTGSVSDVELFGRPGQGRTNAFFG